MSADGGAAALSANINTVEFKVFNRVIATVPLQHVLGLLDPSGVSAVTRLAAVPDEEASEDPDDESKVSAFLQVATAERPEVFGIRVGMHIADVAHVLVVDTAVEYTWAEEVADYASTDLEDFVRVEAAPRVAVATWTIIEEMARTLGATFHAELRIPTDTIVRAVLATREASQEAGYAST